MYSKGVNNYIEWENERHQAPLESTWAGEGEFRHTGHVLFNRSHSSTQSAWKQCLHSGMHLTVSLVRYSDKHIAQVVSLGPGSRLLSPRTSFWYDSIVVWSRPITTMVGSWSGAAATAVEFRCAVRPGLLSLMQAKQAIPIAIVRAGTAMETQIILKTWKPSFVPPGIWSH